MEWMQTGLGQVNCRQNVAHFVLTCARHLGHQLRAFVAHADQQIVHGGQLLFGRLGSQLGRTRCPIGDGHLLLLDPVGEL